MDPASVLVMPTLDPAASEVLWTVLGRGPALAVLVALTLHARRTMGLRLALLGLSGFCAGAVMGTALLPSILGALGGGALGAVATWLALRAPLPGPAFPAAALVGLMAVGRLGCLLGGCCFGTVTDAAFAVHYGSGTLAHTLHHALGLVGAGETARPVVPVQLHESLGLLALLGLALAARRRVRSEGAWALGLVAGVLALRAALDPFRAMLNTAASVRPLGPASIFQWGAAALALLCLAVAVRLARAPATAPGAPRLPAPAWAEGLAWLLQALGAAALHGEGTWLLRVLAVGSLLASGAALVQAAARLPRLRWSLAAAGAVLLVPVAPRAAGGDVPLAGGGWIYGAYPSGRLVRLGPGSTPPAEQTRRYFALLQVPAEPASPPLVAVPEQAPAAPDAGVVEAEAPRRRTFAVSLAGGQTAFQTTTCSGPGSTVIQGFAEAGGQYEQELEDHNVLQLHGRLLASGTGGTSRGAAGATPGGGFTGGAFHEWWWPAVSLGLGVSLGAASPSDLYPMSVLPLTLGDARLVFWPQLYLRLEAIQGWAWELGTGSRFQPADGVFMGFRFGLDEVGSVAGRVGVEFPWLPNPLVTVRFYAGVGFPVAAGTRLELRLQGLPAEACTTATPCGPSLSGMVRVVHDF